MSGTAAGPFALVANALWLDFVNTEVVSHGEPRDLLRTVADLVAWVRAARAWDDATVRRLGRGADESTYRGALALRRRLRALAAAAAGGKEAPAETVRAVNRILGEAPVLEELTADGRGGLLLRRRPAGEDPIHLLLPVAISAAAFLAEGNPRLVKQCRAPDCILFFYDTTKNRRRRWCSMASCGNRAKAAAFQRRRRVRG